MANFFIYLMFFVSGISGLVYQAIWVREFGNVFGNTVYSSSLVTAVFMFGLGVGAYLAGLLADRYGPSSSRPLKYYFLAEIFIGLWGYTISMILPHLGAWSASTSSYSLSSVGWYELTLSSHLIRYFTAIVLLAPITIAMGATLTFLIRFLVAANLEHAGLRTGLLYGLNTAGAALGSLLVDFVLVPHLGLAATQQMAVFLNLLAALMAWLLLQRLLQSEEAPRSQPFQEKYQPGLWRATAALFFAGAAGLGIEIVWFRFLSGALGQYRSVFSLLIAVVLIGIWFGASLAGYLVQRWRKPKVLFVGAQIGFMLSVTTLLSGFRLEQILPANFWDLYVTRTPMERAFSEFLVIFWTAFRIAGNPAIFMGAGFPLANALVQTHESEVGRRAGLLYLGNTFGAVIGSLSVGFVFLPLGGMKLGVIAALMASILAIACLYESGRSNAVSRLMVAGAGLIAITVLALWAKLPDRQLVLSSFRGEAQVRDYLQAPYLRQVSEGLMESIIVVDIPEGKAGRMLYTNGHKMSGTGAIAQRYMRSLVHVPLLTQPAPEDVLVICFGVGNTLSAASLYPSVKRLEGVDLSKHVLGLASEFSETNLNVLKDPRLKVFVNDGRQHLRMARDHQYDLITLEPPPIAFAGVASLYSVEFYELAKKNLKPGGYVTQWLPVKQLPAHLSRALIRAFVEVFPNAILLAPEYGEFILMGQNGGEMVLDPVAWKRHLAANPKVERDLQRIEVDSLVDVLGMFLADSKTLKQAVENDPPVTDDDPSMEYSQVYFLMSVVPEEIINNSLWRTWCPTCETSGALSETELTYLKNYLKISDALYRDSSFLHINPLALRRPTIEKIPVSVATFASTVGKSRYLTRLTAGFDLRKSSYDSN